MAEAASRDRWAHTAALLWIVAESKRDKKKRARPFSPADFNPWERRAKPSDNGKRLTVGVLLAMKGLFDARPS